MAGKGPNDNPLPEDAPDSTDPSSVEESPVVPETNSMTDKGPSDNPPPENASDLAGSVEGPSDNPPPAVAPISTDSPDPSSVKKPKTEKVDDQDNEEEDGESQETYTIDDAVNKAGYGKFQKLLTFLAGLGWLADAFEIIILSLIGDLVACDWVIRRWQNALMTSVVFCGMAIGAPLFGIFADRFGRRTAIGISMLLLFIFGAASAASPNFTWIVVLRGLMGFALGGVAQSVTLCCEYYPAHFRGRAGFYLSYYWSLGSVGVVASAWIVMKYYTNWRLFVLVAAFPALIVFLCMYWYPESARYLLVSNKSTEAVKTLQRMATFNKRELPKGRLIEVDATEERGRIMDLLKPEMRRTTLLFWYIWLAIACAYYGIALITPYIIKNSSLLDAAKEFENTSAGEDFTHVMPCVVFSDENFRDLLWTTAAEFPGIFIFSITIERFNRKTYLGCACILLGLVILLLLLKIPQIATYFILFVGRALVAATFQLLFIMTTEAFPTTLRASAMGTGSGCARIGGLIIPYLAQVTVIIKPIPSICVLAAITAMAGVASFLLPLETRGKSMEDAISKEDV